MKNEFYRIIEPGKVYFDYGPVAMVVIAFDEDEPLTELCCSSFDVIRRTLHEISSARDELKKYTAEIDIGRIKGLPLEMIQTVLKVGEPTLTPMATVAGTVSDAVADWLYLQGASRALVNNGGDIALRLRKGQSVKVGIISDLNSGRINSSVTVDSSFGIGGICTSGLGGRSLTRGIANGVTVLAKSCKMADALATHIANCSYIESDKVATIKAGLLNHETDIPDLDVVMAVDKLEAYEVQESLEQMKREALKQKSDNNLIAMEANVQDKSIRVGFEEL